MKLKTIVLGFLLLTFMGFQAHAAKFFFGNSETIHKIQDVDIKQVNKDGSSSGKLFLGYKTTSHYFIAGLYISDDGYVLGFEGNNNRYFRLTQADITRFQAQGSLPDPMPAYSIAIEDYAIGYSLWIIIGVIVSWFVADIFLSRRRAEKNLERFKAVFPRVLSCAIVNEGTSRENMIELARLRYLQLFEQPLDEREMQSALINASEAGGHYFTYIGSMCRRLAENHKVILLKIYTELLMTVRYTDTERYILYEIARHMKFSKKDIEAYIQLIDASHDARQAAMEQQTA